MEIKLTNSKTITLNQDFLKTYIREYKDYLLPIFVILGSLVIFLFIVVPQFSQYLASRQQLDVENQKLTMLKNNYNYLVSLDGNKMTSDLKLLSKALPSNKDFIGILSSISVVSSKTNVSIGNFSFSLGAIDKNSQQSKLSSVDIDLNTMGNYNSIVNFINEIYKAVPVAEVKTVNGSGSNYILKISFYFKSFPPQNVSDEQIVNPISAKDKALIDEIYKWNNTSDQSLFNIIPTENSSSSAGVNPSPFQ